MLDSYPITEYYGFTEKEVKDLCKDHDMDFETMKAWYNGYLIDGMHMYNPNSVSRALERHKVDSYWRNTSAFGTNQYFYYNELCRIKGRCTCYVNRRKVMVNTNTFQNDFLMIASKSRCLNCFNSSWLSWIRCRHEKCIYS